MFKSLNRGSYVPLLVIVIIIIICMLLVGGVIAWKYISTEKPEPEPPTASWETYRNEEYGFEIKYPKGWVEKESSSNRFLFYPLEEKGEVIVAVAIEKGPLGEPFNPKKYIDNFLKALEYHTVDFELIELKEIIFNGVPAYRLIYIGKKGGTASQFKTLQICIVEDYRASTILFTATPDKYPDYSDTAEEIINSLRFF